MGYEQYSSINYLEILCVGFILIFNRTISRKDGVPSYIIHKYLNYTNQDL